jgi:hypothetical protein
MFFLVETPRSFLRRLELPRSIVGQGVERGHADEAAIVGLTQFASCESLRTVAISVELDRLPVDLAFRKRLKRVLDLPATPR